MINKPRIKIDLNELVAANLVLLSKTDEVMDSDGNRVMLSGSCGMVNYPDDAFVLESDQSDPDLID